MKFGAAGMGLLTVCAALSPMLSHAVETVGVPAGLGSLPEGVERSAVVASALEVSKKIVRSGDQLAYGAFWAVVFYAPIVLLAAFVYRHFLKDEFPSQVGDLKEDYETQKRRKQEREVVQAQWREKEGRWQTGLFDCWTGESHDIFICCCALQFPFIRWADTVSMANLVNFWGAIGIIFALYALSALITNKASGEYGAPASGGVWLIIICICVYFRFRLRKKFEMRADGETAFFDCLLWMFCTPCVIAQEARQVERSIVMNWQPHDRDLETPKLEEPVPRRQLTLPVGLPRRQQIKLTIKSARGLAVADMFTSDPYCVLEYTRKGQAMEKLLQTPVVQRTLDPVWNFPHDMEISEGDLLVFKIFDANRVMADSEMCSAQLDIIRLVSHFDRELTLQSESKSRATLATLRVSYDVVGI